MIEYYHKIHGKTHINCEKPRAYFVPFKENDNTDKRENSSYFTLLNGEWDFRFFENVYEINLNDNNFPSEVECDDKMTVPFCWQMKLNKGYDVPNYINQDYPYPVDPPHLEDVIPCGLYRRKFDFNKNENKSYFINFEGVSSCFYLWINGKFIGYSQVSHCTSEFDVSDKLTDGENIIEALVVKHCDGSYFEDQDFFRLSGIFRDVYILERGKSSIRDIHILNYVDDDLKNAALKVNVDYFNDAVELEYKFFDKNGKLIKSDNVKGNFEFRVENAELWNPENPVLYKLVILCDGEKLLFDVGFRRFEIKNSVVLLNGVKIKAKGINRHDSHPETGYAVTVDEMKKELYMMKAASVNMIRTSHYPNDPRFTELCDRLGFMVVDEADLETHGMGYNYGDWYWDYWAFLTNDGEWTADCVDRAERLFERDKNHSCVVFWSLGNESGCGDNHKAMAEYIRHRDDRALIHYENAHLEYQERLGKDFTSVSDVESRMYASISYLKNYLADESLKKPFFYCEYVCSMSTGDVYNHWDDVEDNDKYFGGCIWEWCDHAVNIGTKENPVYRYGGDFGDSPNDNYSCVDGLVFPDRTPRPGYFDMKKVYQPFKILLNNNELTVYNKRYFTSLNEFYIEWTYENNGNVIASGRFDDTDIAPGTGKKYILPEYKKANGLTTLNVYLKLKEDKYWEKKDYCIGFEQIVLSDISENKNFDSDKVSVKETFTSFVFITENGIFTVSKIDGLISSVKKNGKDIIASPFDFAVWRSTTYNNRGSADVWKRARFDRMVHHKYDVSLENNNIVNVKLSFAAAAMPTGILCDIKYIFTNDGVEIKCNARVGERVPNIPRFGLTYATSAQNAEYLGIGPLESYSDRFRYERQTLCKTNADDNFVHYIKPQECGSHYKTKFAFVTDDNNDGLKITDLNKDGFCFNIKKYSDKQLSEVLHDDELIKEKYNIVNIDYKIDASSNNDEGTMAYRHFNEKEFSFDWYIEIV